VAGASVGVSAAGGTGLRPLVSVTIDAAITDVRMGPRLVVSPELGALPGMTINLTQPETFRALTFRAALVQPISRLRIAPYVGLGFSTRVENDPEPLQRTARWWSAGARLAGPRGWLELGGGMDERLGDGYSPAGHLRGALLLGDRAGINGWIFVEAILALRLGPWSDEVRTDVVTAGVGIGR
jgi:hypothetical protein